MKRMIVVVSTMLTVGAAALLAADFWTEKDFAQWGEKEVEKVLNNSPWSKSLDIAMGGGRPPGGGGGRRGGMGGPPGGGGDMLGGVPGGGGSQGGAPGRAPDMAARPTKRIYLRWVSALPVRQALVRLRFGAEINSPDAQRYLNMKDDRYILVVAGLPPAMVGGGGRPPGKEGERPDPTAIQKQIVEHLKQEAVLKVKGKDPLHPNNVQISGSRELPEIYFAFPRASNGGIDIALEDKDVEFDLKTRSGQRVRRKFKLADMVFKGELEI